MPVNIHGKEYVTVAERVKAGHADEDGVQSIITEMLHFADGIVVFRAVVTLASGRAFTGHAQQSSRMAASLASRRWKYARPARSAAPWASPASATWIVSPRRMR